jgi:selenocysteine lyase/cysteine desulfurase
MRAVAEHEDRLASTMRQQLAAIDQVTVHGSPRRRTPTVLFSVDGLSSQQVHAHLARDGVNAPAGSFYAIEASRWIGLGDAGAVRAGLAPYTSDDDVRRLLAGVADAARGASGA